MIYPNTVLDHGLEAAIQPRPRERDAGTNVASRRSCSSGTEKYKTFLPHLLALQNTTSLL